MVEHSYQRNLDIPLALEAFELLSPLYQENAVIGDEVVESQRLKFPRSIDSVKVDVIEIDLRTAVFVDQCKCGAGNFLRGRRITASAIPLTRVVLPAPRSPRSSTSLGGASIAARDRPSATVSSAE